jgi:6,7-dimethyl-8-ribityllumazine synthase
MTASPRILEGNLVVPKGTKFCIVASRFNHFIVDRLVEGAVDAIVRHGGDAANVTIVRVPGAWEIPTALSKVCAKKKVHAAIAIAAVIRGATPHFDLVVKESAAGVGALTAEGKIAVAFGVLACDNIEQAVERAGAKAGNRGADAAMVAVEMADLYARIDAQQKAEAVPVSVVPAPTTDLPRRK